ncbi:MAG: cupin domain-containing protein [Acidobacteriota bacterium]
MRTNRTSATLWAAIALALPVSAQPKPRGPEKPFWALKSVEAGKYSPPHRPLTRVADLKARHKGESNWREVVVDDEQHRGEYVFSAPGAKVTPRLHPDTRAWWIVLEGQIRFEIEGQQPLVATRGSMVQAPMQTIYSMETAGDQPSLRFEVNIAGAKTFYPAEVEPPSLPGFRWIRALMNRTPGPYDGGNQPHINLHELAAQPEHHGRNFTHRFVNDDRGVANVIYGWEKNLPPLNPNDRGHYHPECAEFWLILAGKVRYPIENVGVVIAEEGDVVYVPIFTFHAPRFHGPEASCRLAMNGYPNIAHVREAAEPH